MNRLRYWWQSRTGREETPLDGDAPAWAISLLVHLIALLVLAGATLLLPTSRSVSLSARSVEAEPEPVIEEFRFQQNPAAAVGALSEGGVDGARPEALELAEASQIAYELPPTAPVAQRQVLEFDRTIFTGPNVSENLLVKGAGSVGALGADGAVDRLTHEILLSLEAGPTLVVWLFDESGSLQAQRESIAKRFEHVYDELGVIEASGNSAFKQHRDKPLLTAVASFGETVQLLTTKPIDDVAEIRASVRAARSDPSGRENVFQSVAYLADKFRHYRLGSQRRNVMIVVFTDEAGDDVAELDTAVDICRKLAMPVYVVGIPAPFGRQDAFVKYVDPDPNFDQSPQWLPVHQGPESLVPERIKLNFAGMREYDERIDSGFGPYGLCRLTSETGGLYFTVHPNRNVGRPVPSWETAAYSSHLGAFFDETVMRGYRPDYVSVDQYQKLLMENRACAALVEAARLSWLTPMENVRRRFPKVDDAQLARILSQAQREAAKLEPKINQFVGILRQGEPDRRRISKPRWQAGFDLAIGRALAVKVRTDGYNAMLAEAKQGMKFKNERNDTWIIRPSSDVTLNSALAGDAADAKRYLEGVVADHPGTPWALVAQQELAEPLGWRWSERFTDVAGRRARQQARAAINVPRPQMPTPPPKPRRDPPAL
jgi:hypothetical protein